MYAEVLVQQKIGDDFSTLTYLIPETLEVRIGQSVKVPLKRREVNGLVWSIHEKAPSFKTLPIKEINDPTPLLKKNQIALANWITEKYICPKYKVSKLFLPKRILDRKPFRKTKTQKEEQAFDPRTKNLTEEQEKAVKEIITSDTNNFLIHGITGSGKTEIYTRIAKHFIDLGKQVLFLVPEISLTPQMIDYFQKAIDLKAAVIHSKLSEGERYNAWERIWKNEAKLILGSRSSIFSPFQDLAAIIIDEEHELSYKQDSEPRYKTHDVVKEMQKQSPSLKAILGSATPSIETAEEYKDSTIHLNQRIGESILPDIEIVDLRDEFKKQNYSIFSDRLKEELTKTLKAKKQAILFLNRRGSASSIVCRDCGYTAECKKCEVKMTYHAKTLNTPSLICHHCGEITKPPVTCPTCQGPSIRFLGIGTQRIESELISLFPKARVLRADKDTTSTKHGFKDIYKAFKNHEADILVGTQMIAKGLHLPKVNLVGVVLSDIGLNIPDFRTAERNFQLMTQVAGRSGRSKEQGKVIIQTYSPDNQTLQFVKNNNYADFFKFERTQRTLLKNPPFGKLAKFMIQDVSFNKCKELSEKIESSLWHIARTLELAEDLEINVYPSYIPKLKGKYRYIILIKDKSNSSIIQTLLENIAKEDIMNPNVKIDIDPISIT